MAAELRFAALVTCALLSGCGDPVDMFEPIVDGPRGGAYQADLHQCRQLAHQAETSTAQERALTGAALGAVVGLAVGKDGKRADTAAEGTAIGALAGATAEPEGLFDRQQRIIVNCMQMRGHRVVG